MGISNHRSSLWLKINAVKLRTTWLKYRTTIFSGVSVIALATLLGLVAGNFISLGQVINTNNQLAEDIKALAEENQRINQEQHDTLFQQIQCLSEVSVVAAIGNDVTITNLEDCEYEVTPKAGDQAEVIIVPQVIREFQTETQPQEDTKPGKGRKR